MAEIVDLDDYEDAARAHIRETLTELFPDAACEFIEQTSGEYAFKKSEFQALVENLLETNNYPKKPTASDEIMVEDPTPHVLPITYTLESFLEKYNNDPFEYFNENNSGPSYMKESLEFLKDRFRFHTMKGIKSSLEVNKWNLYKSYKSLLLAAPTRRTKRVSSAIVHPKKLNQIYLDETFLINNEAQLRQVIEERAQIRERMIQQAIADKTILTCACCFDEELLVQESLKCQKGHIFCKNCVKKSAEIKITEGNTELSCLTECDSSFTITDIQGVISTKLFDRLEKCKQEKEIKQADIPGLLFCPFCDYAAILPQGNRIFECDQCKKQSCRDCRKESHIPMTCEEASSRARTNIRLEVENKLTEALVRTCWQCGKKFVKEDGCNKMSCVCGATMCYICRQPIKGYNHFIDHPTPTSKGCPLYSNNSQLHFEAIVQEAQTLTSQALTEHPDNTLTDDLQNILKGLENPIPTVSNRPPPLLNQGGHRPRNGPPFPPRVINHVPAAVLNRDIRGLVILGQLPPHRRRHPQFFPNVRAHGPYHNPMHFPPDPNY